MSPLTSMTFTYLSLGLVSTASLWKRDGDLLEIALAAEVRDHTHRTIVRRILIATMVVAWPIVLSKMLYR